MEEVAKIATSLIAIDAKLKSSETALSTHKHKFTDLLEIPTTLGGYGITDGMTATEVAAAIQQAVSDLVNGSGAALDTLKELADALGNDPQFATTVSNALALRVRVDAAQSFSLAQKAQGRSNLDALGIVDKGKADGVASLDGSGKVPSTQLPAMNYLSLGGGVLTGALTLIDALRIRSDGNKHVWFQDASGQAQGLIYSGFGDNGIEIRPYDLGTANTYVSFRFLPSGQLALPSAPNAGASATRKDYVDKLVADAVAGTMSGRAYPRRVGGSAINFNWAGKGGNPTWIWGWKAEDGVEGQDMFVYSPANLSVNYANSAWNAERLQGWDIAGIQNDAQNRANGARVTGGEFTLNGDGSTWVNNTGRNLLVSVCAYAGKGINLTVTTAAGQRFVVDNQLTANQQPHKTESAFFWMGPGDFVRINRGGNGSYWLRGGYLG